MTVDLAAPIRLDSPTYICTNCGAPLLQGDRDFDDGLCADCWLQKCREVDQ